MADQGQAPGYFGKVPAHGDFVCRRVPPLVRDGFDRWLQASILYSKRELGTAWLATWSNSPLWRFVVGADVCGEQAWTGVMMPSADRVGRCFPLLLLAPCNGDLSATADLLPHAHWFIQMEEIALSALEADSSLEKLDRALTALGGSPPALPAFRGAGDSAWWCAESPLVAPHCAIHRGLPSPAAFMALIDGTRRAGGATVHVTPDIEGGQDGLSGN